MNILFFITPKKDTAYLYEDHSLQEAIDLMDYRHFTAIPVLGRDGDYIGTLTEGDLLHYINHHKEDPLAVTVKRKVNEIGCRWTIHPVRANANMEDLIGLAMGQNFVPVVDDRGIYIGIITRRALIDYCYKHSTLVGKKEEQQLEAE